MTRRIRTPRGRYVTVGQYITLANRNECSCEYGHIGDAAWQGGPCMDELLSEQEAEESEVS
jgi:hypothetical protein